MAISKQVKLLNLNQNKMRKVCIDEVREFKMKKNVFFNLKKSIFFNALFWLFLWLCISKMICRA